MRCHDGGTAEGKHRNHLVTTDDCDLCHSTRRWEPTRFNHSGITGLCSNCHNGIDASGLPRNHFSTTAECDECHTTRRWSRTDYDHVSAGYPGDHRKSFGCKKCHGANDETVTWRRASFQPDCGACHASDFERDEHKKTENPERDYTASELRDCAGSCHVYRDETLTEIKDRRNREHRVSDDEFD
ncbi:MAG: hypothetical protein GY944_06970 [bacterium]|nr:hypothetical protein [bacterium]